MRKFLCIGLLMLLPVIIRANGTLVDGLYYTFSSSNNTCTVTYTGSSRSTTTYTGDIVIPETVDYEGNTYTVTTIDTYCFYKGTGITSVSIPKTVTSINSYGFYGCTALMSITVYNPAPPTVGYTTAYTNVPTSVCLISVPTQSVDLYKESSSWNMFTNIEGFGYTFSAITLSATVLSNTSVTISGLISTEEGKVTTDQGFEYWDASGNVNKISAIGTEITATLENLTKDTKYSYRAFATVWDDIVYGEEKTFTTKAYSFDKEGLFYNITTEENSNIQTVEVTFGGTSKTATTDAYVGDIIVPEEIESDGVTYTVMGVGQYAFYNGGNITSVTLPKTISYIGQYAFRGCSQITNLEIPDGVTSYGIYTFDECSALKSINIPNGVIDIPNGLFLDCKSLEEINLPESVTSFGQKAFYNCTSATKINIPSGVTELPSYVFYGCNSLEELIIPECVTSIDNYAFAYCYALTEVVLPKNITTIVDHLFYKCTGITSIPIPDCVTSIGSHAFYDCESLVHIDLPEGLISLGAFAFGNCHSLEEITLPEGVTSIGNYTFDQCKALTKVTLPEKLSSIGNYAFYSCSNLPTITIPDGVVTIGEYAFAYCRAMISISLGCNVSTIGNYALYECSTLTNVYSHNNNPPSCGSRTFSGIPSDCLLYVPVGAYDIYSTANQWKDFFSIIEMTPMSVETLSAKDITYNSAVISGMVEPGYEEILVKGFEYWVEGGEPISVVVDGEDMVYILEDLSSETTYVYHAFASTESGTVYGEEKSFTTLFDADGLYNELIDELDETNDLLNETWGIITSEYDDVEDQFVDDYNALVDELESLLEELEEAYNDGILTKEMGEEIRAKIEEILQQIEELLAAAKEAHEIASGIESVLSDTNGEVQIFSVAGVRLDTPQHGVNIVKCSDGTTKKIFIK